MSYRLLAVFQFAVLFLTVSPNAMATTRYVNGGSGSDANSCTSSSTACKTIGHAISLAASGDSIMVAAATYTENLTLAKNVKVLGSTTATIIDGGAKGIVIKISAGVSGTLQHLTIRNGLALNGGGILNYGTLAIKSCIITGNQTKSLGFGGGVLNRGMARISNTTLSRNTAHFGGGGIYNGGNMTINGSTVLGNNAFLGAGLDNVGTLAINNSTVGVNTGYQGGGLSNAGSVALSNSTISQNTGVKGGGIDNGAHAKLQNSIVSNNNGGNCSRFGITSKGYNLSSDATCNLTNTGDLNNTDPMLGPLQINGGPTQTMAFTVWQSCC